MIWIFTIIAQIWFGFEISFYFLDQMMSIIFIISFGIPSGFGISSMIFYFCSCILGQNFVHVLIHTALLIFSSLYLLRKRSKIPRKSSRFTSLTKNDLIVPLIYLFISLYLTWKIYLPSPRSFSLAFETHLTEEFSFISSFKHGVNSGLSNPFHIHHPNYAGHYAVSHWLTAFHSSMLQIGFASLKISLFVPTSLLLSSFATILYLLALQFNLPMYLAFLSPFLTLLFSGFGFLRFLDNGKRTNRSNDYVSQTGYGKYPRFHPIFHLFYGFRHTSLALPLVTGVIFILFWSIKYKHSINNLTLPFAGFVFGFVMPATQHQTFIGFLVFFGIFLSLQLTTKNFPKLKGFALMIFFGFAFHIPRYLDFEFLKNLLNIEVQWKLLVHHEFIPPFSLWWNNCGVFIIIFLFLSWFQLNSIEYYLYLPSLGCFFIFNFWKLQTLVQYNIFLFLSLVYTIGSCVLLATLYRFVTAASEPESRGVIAAMSLIAVISCTISAAMGVHRQINNFKPLWSISDEHLANWIIEKTHKNSVFIAPMISLNPISALAGRTMYMDNVDVLSHCGFNYSDRFLETQNFWKNIESPNILQIVDYVIVLIDDKNKVSEENWRKIYHTRDYQIYQRNK
ncbi:hypothetical protein TRFO_28702 [Tritrichomonas foetus]|uniref:Mannosyltransferase n=1 Tax=Tritrichomonas foetus TaxID=1144522 RepID=A0A1J4K2F1_9EUKA|nr:hypothetical protein TRFO_28702 [Tritrichomonas foetus]|eukprot:OHT03924.1 hypothetical protein TRFO_28702 [Tritrichomonas foetus]